METADFYSKNPRKNLVILAVLGFLLLSNIFFAIEYMLAAKTVKSMQNQVQAQQVNKKVVNFLNLFIEKVLRSQAEIPFEDRLKLENAIRDLNDPEILARWEQFTGGNNETEIQQGVKDLLSALINKIY